jgi:dolichol-phosphate mannosyltransferase
VSGEANHEGASFLMSAVAHDTLVMIPTYNERQNLAALIDQILVYRRCRVLVIDDDSPDGTGALADEAASTHPGRVEVLHRTGPRGFGRSYRDGFRRALASGALYVFQMDADFSHDPKYLPAMLAAAEHHDLVIGSRYVHGVSVVNWPLYRIVLSTFANVYVRSVTGLPVRDCTSGFRCWRRSALESVTRTPFTSDGYSFQFEMLYEAVRRGLGVTEVPIIFIERERGESKLSSGVVMEALVTPWRLVLRNSFKTRGNRQ